MNVPWSLKSEVRCRAYDRAARRNGVTGILEDAAPVDLHPPGARGAVLFVHGFSGCPNNFHDLPHRVAEAGWRARAMLLPGHGTTPLEFERVSGEDLAAAVVGEACALREEHARLVILGHSMGGALAALAAAQLKPEGLILAAPYFGITFKWYYVLPVERWTALLGSRVRWVYAAPERQPVKRREISKEIVSYAWIPTRAAQTAIGVAKRAAEPSALSQITCPALLIHAATDSVTSPEAARAAFRAIASENKREVWLSNSDHIVFWDYERERVCSEVLTFLRHLEGE